jgi:hypothetical protein
LSRHSIMRWIVKSALQNEIDALRAALERLGKAIDEEARMGQGEDWSLMVGYVQSCLEKLPGALPTKVVRTSDTSSDRLSNRTKDSRFSML